MPEIVDIIITHCTGVHKGFKQVFVIIDKPLNFLYERRSDCLVANDDGFYSSYFYERPDVQWKAFGGRPFDIPMKDGTTEKAYGQWWDGRHSENAPEPIVQVGVATLDELLECYVFTSGYISKIKLENWLRKNVPTSDYYWYEQHRVERELRETNDAE